ncbi:MAG: choice-of-anchor D domain-containing protein, partial [Thermoanaerobaculia bacterium]
EAPLTTPGDRYPPDAPFRDFRFWLIGSVAGDGPGLEFDPTSLDFGEVEVGDTSPAQTVTLTNTGDAQATGLTLSGLPANGFTVDTSLCGDFLPADGRQITAGCITDPRQYCPAEPVTRAQMAVFLSKTFELLLYGP